MYDTISPTQTHSHASSDTTSFNNTNVDVLRPLDLHGSLGSSSSMSKTIDAGSNSTTNKCRKRWRRARVCKNKEEAETQRMTHIVVERNRRKQMNEYLAVLRSLMPESYTQRGDQASIVGGAIEFVKELEQLLQSLEAQKLLLQQQQQQQEEEEEIEGNHENKDTCNFFSPPFSQFFTCPQYSWCQLPSVYTPENQPAVADIEVTLIESHANLRILSRKRPRQLFKMVSWFQTLQLTILHLNITTLDPLIFYSFSTKVEEGCHLTSVDDIAGAVHHMLTIIEEEAAALG